MIDIPDDMYSKIMDGYVPLGISKYLKNGTVLSNDNKQVTENNKKNDDCFCYVIREF